MRSTHLSHECLLTPFVLGIRVGDETYKDPCWGPGWGGGSGGRGDAAEEHGWPPGAGDAHWPWRPRFKAQQVTAEQYNQGQGSCSFCAHPSGDESRSPESLCWQQFRFCGLRAPR